MTRGAVRLGPGPRRMRSGRAGVSWQSSRELDGRGRQRDASAASERMPAAGGAPASAAAGGRRRRTRPGRAPLSARHAPAGHGAAPAARPALQRRASSCRPAPTRSNSWTHRSGTTQAGATMPPRRRRTGRVERGRAGQHAEVGRRRPTQVGNLRDVAARFLHAEDVRMRREARDGRRQQVHAGERGKLYSSTGTGDASATAV